jgi:hypothetical protein
MRNLRLRVSKALIPIQVNIRSAWRRHRNRLARRLLVVDAETGVREHVWPEAERSILSVPIPAKAAL